MVLTPGGVKSWYTEQGLGVLPSLPGRRDGLPATLALLQSSTAAASKKQAVALLKEAEDLDPLILPLAQQLSPASKQSSGFFVRKGLEELKPSGPPCPLSS